MKGNIKVILFMFLIVSFSLNPLKVHASTAPTGTGISSDPYLISSLSNLEWVRDEVNNGSTGVNLTGAYFKQTVDIDLANITFGSIGTDSYPFTGNYDGQGHIIDNYSFASTSTGNSVGFFGYTFNSTIVNLSILNCNISVVMDLNISGLVTTPSIGILVGYMEKSIVENISTSGNLTVQNSNDYNGIGGLIGYTYDQSTVKHSYSTANINATTVATSYIGGLIGFIGYDTTFKDSFFAGTMNNSSQVGSIFGYSFFGGSNPNTVTNVYTINQSLPILHSYSVFAGFDPNSQVSQDSQLSLVNIGKKTLGDLSTQSPYRSGGLFSTIWDETIWKLSDGALPRFYGHNSKLSSISISNGNISFDTNILSYNLSLPNSVTSITLTPTPTLSTSTMTVNGTASSNGTGSSPISLSVGANSIPIVVTAEDGTTTQTYTITVTREALPVVTPSVNTQETSISSSTDRLPDTGVDPSLIGLLPAGLLLGVLSKKFTKH